MGKLSTEDGKPSSLDCSVDFPNAVRDKKAKRRRKLNVFKKAFQRQNKLYKKLVCWEGISDGEMVSQIYKNSCKKKKSDSILKKFLREFCFFSAPSECKTNKSPVCQKLQGKKLAIQLYDIMKIPHEKLLKIAQKNKVASFDLKIPFQDPFIVWENSFKSSRSPVGTSINCSIKNFGNRHQKNNESRDPFGDQFEIVQDKPDTFIASESYKNFQTNLKSIAPQSFVQIAPLNESTSCSFDEVGENSCPVESLNASILTSFEDKMAFVSVNFSESKYPLFSEGDTESDIINLNASFIENVCSLCGNEDTVTKAGIPTKDTKISHLDGSSDHSRSQNHSIATPKEKYSLLIDSSSCDSPFSCKPNDSYSLIDSASLPENLERNSLVITHDSLVNNLPHYFEMPSINGISVTQKETQKTNSKKVKKVSYNGRKRKKSFYKFRKFFKKQNLLYRRIFLNEQISSETLIKEIYLNTAKCLPPTSKYERNRSTSVLPCKSKRKRKEKKFKKLSLVLRDIFKLNQMDFDSLLLINKVRNTFNANLGVSLNLNQINKVEKINYSKDEHSIDMSQETKSQPLSSDSLKINDSPNSVKLDSNTDFPSLPLLSKLGVETNDSKGVSKKYHDKMDSEVYSKDLVADEKSISKSPNPVSNLSGSFLPTFDDFLSASSPVSRTVETENDCDDQDTSLEINTKLEGYSSDLIKESLTKQHKIEVSQLKIKNNFSTIQNLDEIIENPVKDNLEEDALNERAYTFENYNNYATSPKNKRKCLDDIYINSFQTDKRCKTIEENYSNDQALNTGKPNENDASNTRMSTPQQINQSYSNLYPQKVLTNETDNKRWSASGSLYADAKDPSFNDRIQANSYEESVNNSIQVDGKQQSGNSFVHADNKEQSVDDSIQDDIISLCCSFSVDMELSPAEIQEIFLSSPVKVLPEKERSSDNPFEHMTEKDFTIPEEIPTKSPFKTTFTDKVCPIFRENTECQDVRFPEKPQLIQPSYLEHVSILSTNIDPSKSTHPIIDLSKDSFSPKMNNVPGSTFENIVLHDQTQYPSDLLNIKTDSFTLNDDHPDLRDSLTAYRNSLKENCGILNFENTFSERSREDTLIHVNKIQDDSIEILNNSPSSRFSSDKIIKIVTPENSTNVRQITEDTAVSFISDVRVSNNNASVKSSGTLNSECSSFADQVALEDSVLTPKTGLRIRNGITPVKSTLIPWMDADREKESHKILQTRIAEFSVDKIDSNKPNLTDSRVSNTIAAVISIPIPVNTDFDEIVSCNNSLPQMAEFSLKALNDKINSKMRNLLTHNVSTNKFSYLKQFFTQRIQKKTEDEDLRVILEDYSFNWLLLNEFYNNRVKLEGMTNEEALAIGNGFNSSKMAKLILAESLSQEEKKQIKFVHCYGKKLKVHSISRKIKKIGFEELKRKGGYLLMTNANIPNFLQDQSYSSAFIHSNIRFGSCLTNTDSGVKKILCFDNQLLLLHHSAFVDDDLASLIRSIYFENKLKRKRHLIIIQRSTLIYCHEQLLSLKDVSNSSMLNTLMRNIKIVKSFLRKGKHDETFAFINLLDEAEHSDMNSMKHFMNTLSLFHEKLDWTYKRVDLVVGPSFKTSCRKNSFYKVLLSGDVCKFF